MVISFPFILHFPNSSSASLRFFFSAKRGSTLRPKKKKESKRERMGLPQSIQLKSRCYMVANIKRSFYCKEGEIIYLWLAFSLVNANKLSTWLLSEPWPWPHGQSYYILLFQLCLVRANFWFADCQAYFGESKRTGSDLRAPPALG